MLVEIEVYPLSCRLIKVKSKDSNEFEEKEILDNESFIESNLERLYFTMKEDVPIFKLLDKESNFYYNFHIDIR